MAFQPQYAGGYGAYPNALAQQQQGAPPPMMMVMMQPGYAQQPPQYDGTGMMYGGQQAPPPQMGGFLQPQQQQMGGVWMPQQQQMAPPLAPPPVPPAPPGGGGASLASLLHGLAAGIVSGQLTGGGAGSAPAHALQPPHAPPGVPPPRPPPAPPPGPPPAPPSVTFTPEALKAAPERALRALYSSDALQCAATGRRFTDRGAYAAHLDLQYLLKRREKEGKSLSRRWFVPFDAWISGAAAVGADADAASAFFDAAAAAADAAAAAAAAPPASVPVDEAQPACALTGEPFETFWHAEEEEWRYRGAVRLERPLGGVPAGRLVLARAMPREGGPPLAQRVAEDADVAADLAGVAAAAEAESVLPPAQPAVPLPLLEVAPLSPPPPQLEPPLGAPPKLEAPEAQPALAVAVRARRRALARALCNCG
jgi:hypothetical protein